MKPTMSLLILAALNASLAIGQQAATAQPTQAQSGDCPTIPNNPNPSNNTAAVKVPSKLQQFLNKQRQQIEAKTGIPMPDVPANLPQSANSKPVPCAPQVASPKSPQPLAPKLGPDMTITLHCTPMSPKDANGHATLILPNPNDFASPKPSNYLVDSVLPDLSAKTGCWQVKVDPVTKKSFIAE
jgi:hypothetical protein